jgi:menaquinol-cytochrome c reductase iron-sulfur subunit
MDSTTESPDRRRFLANTIHTIQAVIGGTLAYFLGGAILAPSLDSRQANWLSAGNLSDLMDNQPTPVTIRVAKQDGYSQVVDRQVIFLVKTGDTSVRALSSTCTHLGCRVSWDAEAERLKCPCHGGVYDKTGKVMSGPPPAPLATLTTRIDGDQVQVQV